MGDIGQFFPDQDDQYKNINSRILLKEVNSVLQQKKFTIENIDSTVICEAPKLLLFASQMKQNIADDLGCPLDVINIKAKTMEKLGAIGRGEGIAAEVVCLLSFSPEV